MVFGLWFSLRQIPTSSQSRQSPSPHLQSTFSFECWYWLLSCLPCCHIIFNFSTSNPFFFHPLPPFPCFLPFSHPADSHLSHFHFISWFVQCLGVVATQNITGLSKAYWICQCCLFHAICHSVMAVMSMSQIEFLRQVTLRHSSHSATIWLACHFSTTNSSFVCSIAHDPRPTAHGPPVPIGPYFICCYYWIKQTAKGRCGSSNSDTLPLAWTRRNY